MTERVIGHVGGMAFGTVACHSRCVVQEASRSDGGGGFQGWLQDYAARSTDQVTGTRRYRWRVVFAKSV